MSLFWNSIFGQSSYNKLKIKKKKRKLWNSSSSTQVHGTRVPWKNSSGTQVPWTWVHGTWVPKKKKKNPKSTFTIMFQKLSYTFETRFLENRVLK